MGLGCVRVVSGSVLLGGRGQGVKGGWVGRGGSGEGTLRVASSSLERRRFLSATEDFSWKLPVDGSSYPNFIWFRAASISLSSAVAASRCESA